MNLFGIKDDESARAVRQLTSVDAAVITLMSSFYIKDVPQGIITAAEEIQAYSVDTIEEFVRDSEEVCELTDEEMECIFSYFDKCPNLRKHFGSGVILQSEADSVKEEIKEIPELKKLYFALERGLHIIVY